MSSCVLTMHLTSDVVIPSSSYLLCLIRNKLEEFMMGIMKSFMTFVIQEFIFHNCFSLSFVVVMVVAVVMGRRYFPHCSEVLDKFMEDDLPDLFYLEKGSPEEQKVKRTRFVELKEDVQRAFNKDKAEQQRTGLSTPSSSAFSLKNSVNHKVRKS
ncbi:hypothetical protein CsSME_00029591 [Camellia sinensis var. sinensis]